MSPTPQQPPNPVDAAKQAAAAPVVQLKEEATALLAVKRAELATAEQEAQAAADRRYALQQEVRQLEQTVASYSQLTAKIAGAKVHNPHAAETCVL